MSEVVRTDLNPDVRGKVDSLKAKAAFIKNTPALIANMQSSEFVAFREFALNFIILPRKNSLDSDFVEFDSYSLEKSICHNQNIGAPYKSWNAFRSMTAKEVYDFSFENKVNFDEYESTFPAEESKH